MQLAEKKLTENIAHWLNGPFDEATKKEIRRLQKENPEELADAFYKQLSFGTGGMRGIMGVGTNRMNLYTVAMVTQAVANTIANLKLAGKQSVVIGFDPRTNSTLFAQEAAKVLAKNGIEVFLFQEPRPVAVISLAVRQKKAVFGIMITASHNPPKYNGYKVYGPDGGQVLEPYDQLIIDEVGKVVDLNQVKMGELEAPNIHTIDTEVIDAAYLKAVAPLQLHPGDDQTNGQKLNLIYTPLHGAGLHIIPKALASWGFSNVSLVTKQATFDGTFPTVKVPNPEDPAALAMGIAQLESEKGDLLIATDPDTDRLGVVVNHAGKSVILSGNEIGVIAIEHICQALTKSKQFPSKALFIKTIVTSELFKKIALHYKASCLDLLTGFKYIGQKITQFEEESKAGTSHHHFLFGAEESFGYLFGTHVRDKDAIISSLLIAEIALQLKLQKKSLVDALLGIYQKYGVFREKLTSFAFEGREGVQKMQNILNNLRENPPKMIEHQKVVRIEDYLTRISNDLESGKQEPICLPKSNVLRFWLADGTKIVIRPSGTEPKMKLYCAMQDAHTSLTQAEVEMSCQALDTKLDRLIIHLKQLLL